LPSDAADGVAVFVKKFNDAVQSKRNVAIFLKRTMLHCSLVAGAYEKFADFGRHARAFFKSFFWCRTKYAEALHSLFTENCLLDAK